MDRQLIRLNFPLSRLLLGLGGVVLALADGALSDGALSDGALSVVALAAEPGKPNIILIMCDDLGWGDVGFNGNTTIRTPNLDRMAGEALQFRRFYAAAPVCSPTRGSCLTGRHPFRFGVVGANRGHMKTEELTLAELLRERGYRTGHFGKWHLGTLTKTLKDGNRGGPRGEAHFAPPQMHGFDVCFSTESKVPTYDPMLQPLHRNNNNWWNPLTEETETREYGTRYWNHRGEIVTDNLRGDDSRVIMDRAVPFIEQAVREKKPFFAAIWFHAPHLPVVAGPKHQKMYEGKKNGYKRNYYGCITAMDEQVGRLSRLLENLNANRNTLLFFCSDNGPEGKKDQAPGSSGPFRGRKRSLLEGGIRVPAFAHWPAKIQPSKTDFPAVTSDFLPTIAEVVDAEIEKPKSIDGTSLCGVFSGKQSKRDTPIGFQHAKQLALIDDQYKLITSNRGESWRLYDLLNDPGEQKDLADELPDVVAEMKAAIEEWASDCATDAADD